MLTQASSSESTCKRSSAGDTVAATRAAGGAVSKGRAVWVSLARLGLAGCRGAGELAAGGSGAAVVAGTTGEASAARRRRGSWIKKTLTPKTTTTTTTL